MKKNNRLSIALRRFFDKVGDADVVNSDFIAFDPFAHKNIVSINVLLSIGCDFDNIFTVLKFRKNLQ